MINQLQKRLNLNNKEIELIKKEQADVVFSKKIIIVIGILLVINLLMFFLNYINFFFLGLFLMFLFLIIGFFIYNKEKKEFTNIVKEIIIKRLFQEKFENVIYQPDQGLSEDYIKKTGLYPMGNRFFSGDLLSATYKNVGFLQSDVLIQQVTSNGKTTTTTTLFKGRWIVCDFIKNFNSYHQIRSNGFFKNKKPFKFFGDNLVEFEFENPKFNDNFTTYTADHREAYYLINPGYMERIDNLTTYINSEVVYGFIDNKLHVAIFNNQDAFEVKGNRLDEDFIKRIEDDIKLITLIIDGLDLELDIFK